MIDLNKFLEKNMSEENKYKLSQIVNLKELKVDDEILDYDVAHKLNDHLYGFKQIENTFRKIVINPGIWCLKQRMYDIVVQETSFSKEDIFDDFVYTEKIFHKVNLFFNKLHIYKKYGIEVPKRGLLLYGPAGSGKTTSIKKVIDHFIADGKTVVLVWPTDQFRADHVRDFLKNVEYRGVERLILIIEDLGGVEINKVEMKSESSLLAILDNQEKIFQLPTFIIATTNYPEVFMGNLTNRPGRFDDKIEVPFPSEEYRKKLFNFFTKRELTPEEIEFLESSGAREFTPAHIKEVIIRSELNDFSTTDVMKTIKEEIETFKNNFEKKRKFGILSDED